MSSFSEKIKKDLISQGIDVSPSRFPHTYAYDYIRSYFSHEHISRSDVAEVFSNLFKEDEKFISYFAVKYFEDDASRDRDYIKIDKLSKILKSINVDDGIINKIGETLKNSKVLKRLKELNEIRSKLTLDPETILEEKNWEESKDNNQNKIVVYEKHIKLKMQELNEDNELQNVELVISVSVNDYDLENHIKYNAYYLPSYDDCNLFSDADIVYDRRPGY